jgi:hypothetical protein
MSTVTTYLTGSGQHLINLHQPDTCQPPCVIHAPLSGPWDTWPTHWRSDRGIFERLCPHGVGHPAAEDVLRGKDSMHGCCGCPCSPAQQKPVACPGRECGTWDECPNCFDDQGEPRDDANH